MLCLVVSLRQCGDPAGDAGVRQLFLPQAVLPGVVLRVENKLAKARCPPFALPSVPAHDNFMGDTLASSEDAIPAVPVAVVRPRSPRGGHLGACMCLVLIFMIGKNICLHFILPFFPLCFQ